METKSRIISTPGKEDGGNSKYALSALAYFDDRFTLIPYIDFDGLIFAIKVWYTPVRAHAKNPGSMSGEIKFASFEDYKLFMTPWT